MWFFTKFSFVIWQKNCGAELESEISVWTFFGGGQENFAAKEWSEALYGKSISLSAPESYYKVLWSEHLTKIYVLNIFLQNFFVQRKQFESHWLRIFSEKESFNEKKSIHLIQIVSNYNIKHQWFDKWLVTHYKTPTSLSPPVFCISKYDESHEQTLEFGFSLIIFNLFYYSYNSKIKKKNWKKKLFN